MIGISTESHTLGNQTLVVAHGNHVAHLGTTAALSHDGHIAWVTAKVGDIVVNPLQCSVDVQHTYISGILELRVYSREIGIADRTQTVVDAYEDDVALASQILAIVAILFDAVTVGIASTMQPNQYRTLLLVGVWSPDIQSQAVLAHPIVVPMVCKGTIVIVVLVVRNLRSAVAIEDCRQHTFPRLWRLWRHETVLTTSRCAIRDTQVSINTTKDVALYLSVLSLSYGNVIAQQKLLLIGVVTQIILSSLSLLGISGTGCHEGSGQQEETSSH